MEITGRIVADAEVRKTKSNKDVVSFTLAVNDGYRDKNGEWKEQSEFFQCAYWQKSSVASILRKGAIATISGRIHLNEYKGKDGNKYANLAFHVNSVHVISGAQKSNSPAPQTQALAQNSTDDLPF